MIKTFILHHPPKFILWLIYK